MTAPHLVELSKYLSWVLRHEPDAIGLTLGEGGWVAIDALISAAASHGRAIALEDVLAVVRTSDKQRFAVDDTGERIRANQGHSVAVDLQLLEAEPPAQLWHGTARRFLAGILKDGLQRQSRHHVHLSADRATALQVGTRHGPPVILIIDAAGMRQDDHRFWRSANGVWLAEAVPTRYLSEDRP